MNNGESNRRWRDLGNVRFVIPVIGALTFFGLLLAACAPSATPTAPTTAPAATAAAKAATQPVGTTGAAGATAVATVATAVAPTVAAAATSLAPTVAAANPTAAAVGTRVAPTIEAAATALAPTAVAAATAAARSAGTATTTTAGQLADAGQTVYASQCSACHGAQGQGGIGPALWGPNASFRTFKSAQDLLTFVAATMPKTHPGSLTPEQYTQVAAYILVQNGIVQRSASLSSASLGSIQLNK